MDIKKIIKNVRRGSVCPPDHANALADHIEKLEAQLAIACEYLNSISLHHPHLVPHEITGANEIRLTIWDTEEAILEKDDGF